MDRRRLLKLTSVSLGTAIAIPSLSCSPAPPPPAAPASGLWDVWDRMFAKARFVSLSHVLTPATPLWKGFPAGTRFERGIARLDDKAPYGPLDYAKSGFETTGYQLVTDQMGTQLDPPAHWHQCFPAIDELPPTLALRKLAVISIVERVQADVNYALTAAVVQMPLTALKISANRFRKHVAQFASLQEMALKSNEVILAQTQITAACNALHNVEQRFCRWLLQSWDRSEADNISLTQEFLGEMLGVRRTSVTEIASKLQDEGIIRYRRGHIELLNRRELEKRSCECFHAVRRAQKTIMGIELKT